MNVIAVEEEISCKI